MAPGAIAVTRAIHDAAERRDRDAIEATLADVVSYVAQCDGGSEPSSPLSRTDAAAAVLREECVRAYIARVDVDTCDVNPADGSVECYADAVAQGYLAMIAVKRATDGTYRVSSVHVTRAYYDD